MRKSVLILAMIALVALFAISCKSEPIHEHEYVIENHDNENHWKECECGEKSEVEPHSFEEWISDGEDVSQTCSICNFKEHRKGIIVKSAEELKSNLESGSSEFVVLGSDVVMNEPLRIQKAVELNLNNKNLKLDAEPASVDIPSGGTISGGILIEQDGDLVISGNGIVSSSKSLIGNLGELEIIEGTFTVDGNASVIRNAGKLIIKDGNFETKKHVDLFMYPSSSQEILGGNFTTDGFYTIFVNGTSTDKNTSLVINDGNFNEYLYLAGFSNTTINGGSFKSEVVNPVYVKSGNITISGGTFDCNPNQYPYDYINWNNGSFSLEGDVVVEACDYPGGNPSLIVKGGSFKHGLGYYVKPEITKEEGTVNVDDSVANVSIHREYSYKKEFEFTYEFNGSTSASKATAYFSSEKKADEFSIDTKIEGLTITKVSNKESIGTN